MLVTNSSELLSMLTTLTASKFIAVDLETTGLDMLDSKVVGIAIADQNSQWYIPTTNIIEGLWENLSKLLHSGLHTFISHNAPFDMHFLNKYLLDKGLPGLFSDFPNWWDTMSMAALLDENMININITLPQSTSKTGALSLKTLSYIFLQRQQLLFPGVEEFAAWPAERQAEYAIADARNCYDLAVKFSNLLKQSDLLAYYKEFVAPISYVTLAMEENGIKVDIPKLLQIQKQCQADIEGYVKQLQDIVPPTVTTIIKGRGSAKHEEVVSTPFNPKSGMQLGRYLLSKKYKLPLTQTGRPSVDAETIKALAEVYPEEAIFAPLIAMRQLEKMKGTYVDGCLEFAWEDDRVHPEWNGVATVTGRLSATTDSGKELTHKRGPAMQTIPTPDTMQEAGWNYNPREWFIAPPGKLLCVADLSQAEVRMLAVKSQDVTMIEAVNSGVDTHASMAAKAYPAEWGAAKTDKERKAIRSKAKAVTFGITYGMGPGALAKRLNIEYDVAEQMIRDYYDTFPGIKAWKDAETYKLQKYGFVSSFYGRRRSPIFMVDCPKVTVKKGAPDYIRQQMLLVLWQAEYDFECKKSGFDAQNVEEREAVSRSIRQAINFNIQGSVAEYVNVGLIAVIKQGYKLLGQVHDEILVEINDNEDERRQLKEFLSKQFEKELNGVKFILDCKFGKTWAIGKE